MRTNHELIRELNDTLRRKHKGGSIAVSQGIQAFDDRVVRRIGEAIAAFDAFNEPNDPHGEHDFGCLLVAGHIIIFKIDYYDRDLQYHSPDPANPEVTHRVMTIMLAEEY